jgi:hypothetical protein
VETAQAAKNDRVFEIINKVLQRIVGDQATRLIYDSLERRYSLKLCEISDNLNVFTECLKDILNDAALPIENVILNEILSICDFGNAVTFEIAVPEEPDPSAVRVATSI